SVLVRKVIVLAKEDAEVEPQPEPFVRVVVDERQKSEVDALGGAAAVVEHRSGRGGRLRRRVGRGARSRWWCRRGSRLGRGAERRERDERPRADDGRLRSLHGPLRFSCVASQAGDGLAPLRTSLAPSHANTGITGEQKPVAITARASR